MEERAPCPPYAYNMCIPEITSNSMGKCLPVSAAVSQEHSLNTVQHDEERSVENEMESVQSFDTVENENLQLVPYGQTVADSNSLVTSFLGQGVCGLRNLGNTCFMNAGLQCLINMPSICQHFFENMSLPIKSTQEVNLSTPFRDLLFEVWGRRRTDFRPVTFKDSLASKYSQFEGFRQHDCQEFLALLLNSLHEELNLKKPGGHTAYDNSRGDGRYHNRGDIRAASGHNGATNSNTGALMEEELDEDELRKIEHKNQDEQPTSIITSSVLVDSADMESESAADAFAQKLSASNDLPPDNSLRNDKISQSFECGGGFTSGEALRSWSNKKQLNEDIFDERQDSPSNVMKKMKLDDGCCDASMSPGAVDFGMDLVKDKGSATFPKESFLDCHESMLGGATGIKKGSAIQDESKLVWDKYLDENQSIIAQTFQGQFRSTICCAFCYHKSVTYEPFMYLPVPLPHALERQLKVMFVPSNVNESRRHLLVTVNKHGTVSDVRKQLVAMLNDTHVNNSTAELVLAVGGKRRYTSSDGTVERILEDTNKLMHVPESSFFYAFKIFNTDEDGDRNSDGTQVGDGGASPSRSGNRGDTMQSVGGAIGASDDGRGDRDDVCRDDEDVERRDDNQGEEHGENDVTRQPEERSVEVAKWKQCCICLDDRFISDVRLHSKCGAALCHTCFDRTVESNNAGPSSGGFEYGDIDGTGQSDIDHTLGAFEDYDAYTGQVYGPEPCSQANSTSSTMTPDVSVGAEADSMAVDPDPPTPVPPENSQSSEDLPSGDVIEMGDDALPGATDAQSGEERASVVKSTAPIRCPMCNSLSDEADFVCFGKESEGVVRSARLMMMTVVYRVKTEATTASFGGMTSAYNTSSCFEPIDWPRMMYVFDNISADDLHTRVRKEMLPLTFAQTEQFRLFRTESCGTKCSRCYKSSCDCSLIEIGSASCDFIPGDTICVELTLEEGSSLDSVVSKFSPVEDDESMGERRPNNSKLSLMECVEAFTAGEVLDENNPWWCPQCQANRSATKQIQLWRLPETLVIYLKRFYFDNLTSYKLENVVECPETLDLRSICSNSDKQEEIDATSKDREELERRSKKGSNNENDFDSSSPNCNNEGSLRSNLYQLQSCVCHVGNANAGHYTAYARNPLSGLWYYFNDETVSLKEPKYDDSPEIYILFYQRRDRTYHLDVPSNLESFLPASTDDAMAGSLAVATVAEVDSSATDSSDVVQKTYSQNSLCSNSANNLAVERLVTNTHRPDMALSSSSCANSTQLVRVEEESESMTSSVTATVATQGQADGEEGGNGLRVAGDTYKLMQPHAQASLDVSSGSFSDYGRSMWPPPTTTSNTLINTPSPSGGNDYNTCAGSGGDVFFIP